MMSEAIESHLAPAYSRLLPLLADSPHVDVFLDQVVRVAAALAVILRQAEQALVHRQLTDAMASRSVIDQALGVVMGQQRCTASEAFALLRQASQHRNRKLRDVAAEIITQVTGETPQPASEFVVSRNHD